MKIYTELLDLLKDYVGHKGKVIGSRYTLKELAQRMGLGDAAYFRRWSNNKGLTFENMEKLVRATRIPFEVIARLQYNNPTLFSVETLRFETSVFDRDYVNKKVLRNELLDAEKNVW